MYIGINAQNLKKWLRTYNSTLTLWELRSELEIYIFLLFTHATPIFGLRWTQLNGIITCPHHEVTLDNFGFLVGAHSTVWWAVTRPQMAEGAFWGPKMQLFWPKIYFLETLSNIFDTIMAGHEKHNFFVLIQSQGGPRGGRWGWNTSFLTPKKATLGNRGHKTARRAAERPSTGKPKVSRVTSGYRGLMIPLSRDRPSRENVGFIGVG